MKIEPYEVTITPAMKNIAADINRKVSDFYSRSTDYTNLNRKDKYYFGTLGELAFHEFLDLNEVSYNAEIVFRTHADNGDVNIDWYDGSERVIDVKTATQPTHRNIMMPVSQMDKNGHKYDYYVGVRLMGDFAEIWGYCTASAFLEMSEGFDYQNVPTLYLPLDELQGIRGMLDYCVRRG